MSYTIKGLSEAPTCSIQGHTGSGRAYHAAPAQGLEVGMYALPVGFDLDGHLATFRKEFIKLWHWYPNSDRKTDGPVAKEEKPSTKGHGGIR